MLNSFLLSEPVREKRPREIDQYRSKPLSRWIAELPAANHGLTTRLLHDRISSINRTDMDANLRLEAIETLSVSYHRILDYLSWRIRGKGFPLGTNEQKIGTLLLSMSTEYAMAYWICLRESSKEQSNWRTRKHMALIVQRVMREYANILMSCYLLRLPESDWIWMDLHSLYKLALKQQIQGVKIKNPLARQEQNTTIEDTYKQILLFHMSYPYGLTQKEIIQVYFWSEQWSQLVQLLGKGDSTGALSFPGWVVNSDEDRAPYWLEQKDAYEEHFYRIDVNPLLRWFKEQYTKTNPGPGRFELLTEVEERDYSLTHGLLNYLEYRFAGQSLSGSGLFQGGGEVLLSIGLKATHQQLKAPSKHDEIVTGEWLVNIEPDNRTLSCHFSQYGQIFIGGLVSVKSLDSGDDRRFMGIVCSIFMERIDAKVQFQIIVLTPNISAVGIQPQETKSDDVLYQRGLLLLQETHTRDKEYLVVSAQNLKDGDILKLLKDDDHSYSIQLKNRQNIGLGYIQFEYEVLPDEEKEIIRGYDFI